MSKKQYSGFTLVEMLIVMGILIILMAIGVAVGRFAIQRANNIQHNSAAEQLSQAIAASYVDLRRYPAVDDMDASGFGTNGGGIDQYIDAEFDGGSDASYYYFVDSTQQSYLICVSYGGIDDQANLGGYCTGNGFGTLPRANPAAQEKTMDDSDFSTIVEAATTAGVGLEVEWTENAWGSDQ